MSSYYHNVIIIDFHIYWFNHYDRKEKAILNQEEIKMQNSECKNVAHRIRKFTCSKSNIGFFFTIVQDHVSLLVVDNFLHFFLNYDYLTAWEVGQKAEQNQIVNKLSLLCLLLFFIELSLILMLAAISGIWDVSILQIADYCLCQL